MPEDTAPDERHQTVHQTEHAIRHVWRERPGEGSWSGRCTCGFVYEHLQSRNGALIIPPCPRR